MKDSYANFRNKSTINTLLGNPEYEVLARSFCKDFFNIEIEKYSIHEFSDAVFILKGAFSNDLEIIVTDKLGIKQLLRIRFLEMHPGLTSAYMDASSSKWRDLKMRTQNKGFFHSYCQNVRELCFFYFNSSKTEVCHSIKKYEFDELPKIVQFDCYELQKFNKDINSLIDERDIWLYTFKYGGKAIQSLENTPFTEILKKSMNRKNWSKVDNQSYESYEKYNIERAISILERYKEEQYKLNENYITNPISEVELNWIYLEKQLGKLPKNRVIKTSIDIKAIESDLPKLAFDLFRKWTKACHEKYPHIDLTIIDEQVLVKDIEQIVRESVIELFDDDDFYFRNMSKSYALNFVLGYIEGRISVHWYMEYVIKTRDEYKTTMALRSLNIFLQLEDVMRIKVEHIYQKIMKDKVNLSNPDLAITNINLTSEKGDIIETNESSNVIQTVLTNLINKHIHEISTIKTENFNLNISENLDDKKVLNFIEADWHLF